MCLFCLWPSSLWQVSNVKIQQPTDAIYESVQYPQALYALRETSVKKVTNSDKPTKEFPPATCSLQNACQLYDKRCAFKLPPKRLRKQDTYVVFICMLTFGIWSEKQ